MKDLQILPFKKVFKVKFKFEHTIDCVEMASYDFHIPKIWQILKRFSGTFHQA